MRTERCTVFIAAAFAAGFVAANVWTQRDRSTVELAPLRVTSSIRTPLSPPAPKASTGTIRTWASLVALAATDPAAAVEQANQAEGTDSERSERVLELTRDWARRDPGGAWAWVRSLGAANADLADGALPEVVLEAMASRSPDLLALTVTDVLAEKNAAGPFAAEVIAATGLQALTANGLIDDAKRSVETWVRDPALPDIGAAALETVAAAIGRGSPTDAAAWLTSLPESSARSDALANYAATWGERDPDAALAWAKGLPDTTKTAALERTFTDLIERNPAAASAWLGALLTSSDAPVDADRLLETYVNRSPVTRAHPELASQWLALIGDPVARRLAEQRIQAKSALTDAD